MDVNQTTRLFEGARAGEDGALDRLYVRCAAKLLPLIRLRLGRDLRAQLDSRDILQAVLLKSFQRLDQVREGAALMGWLARIAENEIRDQADRHHRQRRDALRQAPIDDAADVPAPVRQALSLAILSEEAARLERALEALPDAQREVVALRTFEELSFPEIAERLGKTADACRMTFARAMTSLTLALRMPA